MLVPAYRALGWTGTSGPDAVSRSLLLTLFLLSMLIWIRLIIVNADLDKKAYLISAPDAFGDSVLFHTISPHDKYS